MMINQIKCINLLRQHLLLMITQTTNLKCKTEKQPMFLHIIIEASDETYYIFKNKYILAICPEDKNL